MFKRFWSVKAFILSFESAFIFCFFTGIFWNPPIRIEVYDEIHRFYIHRGEPISWAGISAADKQVEFPIVKAPFLQRHDPFGGPDVVKIIDLRVFVPLFISLIALSFLLVYPLYFIFVKAGEENKFLNRITIIPLFIILSLGCIFAYFMWFPRI